MLVGTSTNVASTIVPRLTARPPSAAEAKAAATIASPTPHLSRRCLNLHSVVASGTASGETPTKERIADESQTCSSHSRSDRPKHSCTMYILSMTRSSSLGLPMRGSTPRASASALRAAATSAAHPAQGHAASSSARNRALRVSRGLPACISSSENVGCAAMWASVGSGMAPLILL